MKLTLKAIRYKSNLLVSPLKATFGENGGTIGRSSTNHYVLEDEEKVVSNQHAVIQFEEGSYYFQDKSLNGTLFTNPDRWIHHEKMELQDQQTLFIGDYEVVVTLCCEPSENVSHTTAGSIFSALCQTCDDNEDFQNNHQFFDDQPDPNEFSQHGQTDQSFETGPSPASGEIFTPPLVMESPKRESNLPRDLSLEDFFSDEDHVRGDIASEDSKAVTLIGEIDLDECDGKKHIRKNQNWPETPAAGSNPLIKNEPPVQSPPLFGAIEASSPSAAHDRLLKAFLKTAGLEDIEKMPQEKALSLMHTIGNVLKELTEGLMTILRGRTELKSQLHVSMTVINKAENNPLKFSPTVEEALNAMLIATPVGFLNPVEAVREGFEDIKNHQLAITAGVQSALTSTLKRFDPENLEKQFNAGLKSHKKTRCWREYRQSYADIVEQAFEDFFGEAFVRAYEAQMDKLRFDHKKAG